MECNPNFLDRLQACCFATPLNQQTLTHVMKQIDGMPVLKTFHIREVGSVGQTHVSRRFQRKKMAPDWSAAKTGFKVGQILNYFHDFD
jgi:hypothetical protein